MPMDSIMDTSSFSDNQPDFSDAQPLFTGGATCDCFRVRLYGKLHFLKRLKTSLATNPRYVAALQKEFETGYQLEHPHLVSFISKTNDAILMDYVDGETLDVFVQNHPDYFKHRNHADRFLRQLLDVVDYLHEHQVIHLDLKPGNILITRIGHDVKLIDLGFCYTDAYPDTMGRTDKYAAPEQLKGSGEKPTPRTDIYAIGKILEQLPCARFYHYIIQKCTAEHPDDRFSSIKEMSQRLHRTPALRRFLWPALFVLAIILLVVFLRTSVQQNKEPSLQETAKVEEPLSVDTVSSTTAHVEPEVTETPTEVAPSETTPKSKTTPTLSGHPSATVATETPNKARSKTMTDKELKQRISSVAEPIFQRAMGQLRDSAWNQNTEMLYYKLYRSFLDECGGKERALWIQLSKEYAIDEYTFYHLSSDVNINLQNNLYEQMLRNASIK